MEKKGEFRRGGGATKKGKFGDFPDTPEENICDKGGTARVKREKK